MNTNLNMMKTNAYSRLIEQATLFCELANSGSVRDLGKKIFGKDTVFEPQELYLMDTAGEPRMWIHPKKDWSEQQLKYFMGVLDANPNRYRVNYVLPDPDKGTRAIQITFFKSFKPTRT